MITGSGWTAWSTWSICSTTCGKGSSVRLRTCTDSSGCAGESQEEMECENSDQSTLSEYRSVEVLGKFLSPVFSTYSYIVGSMVAVDTMQCDLWIGNDSKRTAVPDLSRELQRSGDGSGPLRKGGLFKTR